jgi:hypothetical protein
MLLVVLGACPVLGQEEAKPIQLSLFAPVQLVPEETPISGVRLGLIYSKNTSVSGLDLGLITHCTSDTSVGVQFGLVGLVDANYIGWQDNFVNVTREDFKGFQWGVVSYARRANGFPLGVVNYAMSMKGLQIGLVNIIKQGGQFPVFPIVNWSF